MDKQQSRREALAKRVYGMCWPQEAGWPTWCGAHEVAQRRAESVADFIIAEQERREGPLRGALERARSYLGPSSALEAALICEHIDAVLSPPQRTVEEIARDVAKILCGDQWRVDPLHELGNELSAALRRADGKE